MCILCHDTIEKYLKAYIVSCGIKPERIHDLVTLLNECIKISENPQEFEIHREGCQILNRYYTPLKYPSHYPVATKEQATEAIEIATDIGKFITECIGECK